MALVRRRGRAETAGEAVVALRLAPAVEADAVAAAAGAGG